MKAFCVLVLFLLIPSVYGQSWMPISKTCNNIGNGIFEGYTKLKIRDIEQLRDEEGLKLIDRYLSDTLYSSVLLFNANSTYISDKVVRVNLRQYIEDKCKIKPTNLSFENLVKTMKKCSDELFSKLETKSDTFEQHRYAFTSPVENETQVIEELREFFKKYIPFMTHLPNKYGGIATVYSPKINNVPITHEVYKTFIDEKFTKIAKGLHFYLLDLMLDASQTGKVKGKDIFQDLVLYFKKSGFDQAKAHYYSMHFLGAYASRGASIYAKLNGTYLTSFSALFTLSLAISYLDKIAKKNGKSYAIPYQYKATCQLSKPYHFWMAAFQTFYGVRQKFGKIPSYFIPVASGIIYETVMEANGRDVDKLFKIKTPYDPYANSARIDNWARTLGAHFGKAKGSPKSFSSDKYLIGLFKRAKMPSKIPKTKKEILQEYIRMINPIPMILRLSL